MIPKGLCLLLPGLLVVAGLAASCSDEKTVPMGPDTSLNLPPVPRPELPLRFNLMTSDSAGTIAQALATRELAKANELARMGRVFLDPLSDARWGEKEDACRKWVYPYSGCASTYWLCELDNTYLFALTAEGLCGGNFHVGEALFAGTMSASGNSGTGQVYGYLANTPDRSWTWTTVGTPTWTFYAGDLEVGAITEILTAGISADLTRDIGLELPLDAKWTARTSGDTAEGVMRLYDWDAIRAEYILHTQISWDHGAGSWLQLGAAGDTVGENYW